MLYLGIDQSLRGTGLAFVDEHANYVSSTTISVGREIVGAERLAYIAKGFNDFVLGEVRKNAPTFEYVKAVAREGFSMGSTNRPFDLGMVAGVLELLTYEKLGLSPLTVPPKQLKKFATGSASADKQKMLYMVKSRLSIDLKDRDDEADAVFLALFAWSHHRLEFSSRAAADVVYKNKQSSNKKPRVRRASSRTNI